MKKGFEAIAPCLTDFDASAAVDRVLLIVGIATSINDVCPRSIFWRASFSAAVTVFDVWHGIDGYGME
jgi:hypothetical protein